MTQEETVIVRVAINIDVDDAYDTEIPVAQWNAMTPEERDVLIKDIWETMAQSDSGGFQVLTPGAEGL